MAKARMLSKSISTSEKVNRALVEKLKEQNYKHPYDGPLLYSWLHPHADDWGRIDGFPYWIKLNVVPGLDDISESDVELILGCMKDVHLIEWYVVDGKKIIQILNFEEHQQGLHKRTDSKFPEFPGNSVKVSEIPGITEQNRIEQEQKKDSLHTPEEPARPIANTPRELENFDFVLRLHDSEFELWFTKINQMIALENQTRNGSKFTWVPTTGSMKSDLKSLIYKIKDDEKKEILTVALNVLGQKMNWPEYVRLCILHIVRVSEKTKVDKPFGFCYSVLKKPGEIASSKSDGPLSGIVQGFKLRGMN